MSGAGRRGEGVSCVSIAKSWKDMYIPMTMTPQEARALVADQELNSDAIVQIEKIIFNEKVTPLQAQAMLTMAWHWVISQGRITDRMR